MTKALKTVILVPRRPDGARRDEVWAFCKAQLLRLGWEIREGDHPGIPFSRAWAMNAASEPLTWDVAFCVDADILLAHPRQAKEAVQAAVKLGTYSVCHQHLILLDKPSTDRVIAGTKKPGREEPMESWINWTTGFAVTRDLWVEAGGFDNRFIGNGGQDLAFLCAAQTFGNGKWRGRGRIYHLWHPYASRDHEHWYPNCALAKRYESVNRNREKMRAIIAER